MKAIVYRQYGTSEVLQLEEIEKPVPKSDEVLVKVRATSFNKADWYSLTGKPFLVRLMSGGIVKPKNIVLGFDFSGKVEAIGENVTRFEIDDEVYGDLSGTGGGGLSEYVAAPENILAKKPTNISFEQAAAVPMAAVTALNGLLSGGEIQPDWKVLINGASGGVGTFAVQIAKSFGAEVTAVCSTRNVEQAFELGADYVIDYTKENFTQNDKKYDLILAANGYHDIVDYQRVLTPSGIYVVSGGSMKQIFQVMMKGKGLAKSSDNQFISISSTSNIEKLSQITKMIEAGSVNPKIDKNYSFNDAAKAMEYIGKGHAQGKVVVTVSKE